ncbi:MAG: glycosyltransferase family 4 protein [bacterium]
MRIGIEIDWAHKFGGMRAVAINLLREIIKIDNRNEYIVYTNTKFPKLAHNKIKQTVILSPHPLMHVIWDQFILPHIIFPWKFLQDKIDIVLYSGTISSFYKVKRSVLMIHDLTIFTVPESYNKIHRTYQRLYYKWAVYNADHIITVSESSRRDILRLFRLPEDRVTAIALGVGEECRVINDESLLARVRNHYRLPGHFILNVGTIQPRKNLVRLVESFAQLRNELPHKLVIVGRQAWRAEELFFAISKHKLEDHVIFLGMVPNEDLPVIYNLADIFVYPSLYEGFGLPVLEAMSCGTPTITSNNSSLAEVAGDAALLVDPKDVESITEALRELALHPSHLNELRCKGLSRAKIFSWERTARETLNVFENFRTSN